MVLIEEAREGERQRRVKAWKIGRRRKGGREYIGEKRKVDVTV